jgi:regulator of ribonuclease activity A
LIGDLIAKTAIENGWAGVVVYGCVRDVDELSRLPFGIKALGSNPRRSAKVGVGEVDVPVSLGGATLSPAGPYSATTMVLSSERNAHIAR